MACEARAEACAQARRLSTRPLFENATIIADTVHFPAEGDGTLSNGPWPLSPDRASGVCVCYSGLLRGFGGNRSGALDNHARHLLRPLTRLFPDDVHVAFSTAYDAARGRTEADSSLPTRVRDTLRAQAGISGSRVLEERRPDANGSNYMQQLSFVGIAHCGRLIARMAEQRGAPFGFAVRMRYDLLLDPRLGAALPSWPIWEASAASSATTPASPPVMTLSKFVNENGTSTRGLQLFGCPWQLPVRRCIPQDVFFVVRRTAMLGPVETLFTHHTTFTGTRWFLTDGLKLRQHASERTLFDLPLARGVPLDILYQSGGECLWMLVDDRSLDDARAPRAVFRGRCMRLRRETRPLPEHQGRELALSPAL